MDSSLSKAPFPAPPPFWKHFTTANLQRLKDLDPPTSTSTTEPLPLELTYLRPPPPPPPTAATYPTFSQPNFTTITPILPDPSTLLFNSSSTPPPNPAVLLTRLTKSLLLNFLELLTILAESPEDYAEKVEDINTIVVNVHAVINMYRPHQAREEVKGMLEGMLEEGRREVEEGERVKGEIEGFLRELQVWKEGDEDVEMEVKETDSGEVNGHAKGKGENEHEDRTDLSEKQVEEAKRLWKLIDEIGED